MLTVFLMFSACKVDKNSLPAPSSSGKDLVQLRQEMRDHAKADWEEFTRTHAMPDPGARELLPCKCSYQILSANVQPLNGWTDYEVDFFSSHPVCGDPLDPFTCNYFSGLFFNGLECDGGGNNPSCIDHWNSLPPSGLFSFNCDIPPFSYFDVRLNAASIGATCLQADYTTASITFRIVCVENCGDIAYQSFSEPITLTFDGIGGWNDGSEWTAISLDGCGCRPLATE